MLDSVKLNLNALKPWKKITYFSRDLTRVRLRRGAGAHTATGHALVLRLLSLLLLWYPTRKIFRCLLQTVTIDILQDCYNVVSTRKSYSGLGIIYVAANVTMNVNQLMRVMVNDKNSKLTHVRMGDMLYDMTRKQAKELNMTINQYTKEALFAKYVTECEQQQNKKKAPQV